MEDFVVEKVKEFLKIEGYIIDTDEHKELWAKGVDIKMKHKDYGKYYLIECKGDPGSRGAVKSISGSMSSSLNSAVGQIISRMHTTRKSRYGGYNYGIAFPVTFREKALKRVPYYVCKNLHMRMFFLNHKGEVEKIDSKEIKEHQQKNKRATD